MNLTACGYCDELHCVCPRDDAAEHVDELTFAAVHEEQRA